MRYALTFLMMATVALGQGVWPKTATVVDGGHRYDFDTLGKRSVTPSADYGNMVLWQAFSYSDNSDADFYDLSTSGNDGAQGTAASQPTWSSADGGTYSFDGVDDVIPDTDKPFNGVDDMTISCWVYPDQTNGTKQVMSSNQNGATAEENYLAMYVSGGSWRVIHERQNVLGGALVGSASAALGSWTHLVHTATRNGDLVFYANAVEIGRQSGVGNTAIIQTISLPIGARDIAGTLGLFWEGSIDDVRYYDTALTAAQILAIADNTGATYYPYFSGFTESFDTYSDLALWMPFTSDETPDYIDKGPLTNSGVQTNAASQPTWSSADGGVYSFDGVDDVIPVADSASIQNIFDGGGTITAWVNLVTLGEGSGGRVVDKRSASGTGFIFFTETAASKLAFLQEFSGGLGRWDTTAVVATNEWLMVAVSYDSGSTANNPLLYINATSEALSETATPSGTRDSDVGQTLNVGNVDNLSATTDGSLDDVRIYDTALTAAQIGSIYTNTAPTYGISP